MPLAHFIRRTPSAVLLAVQFLAVVLYPFWEESVSGRSVIAAFGLTVLAAALLAVRATPLLTWVAIVIALPAVGLLLAQIVTGNDALTPWAAGFESALYFYAGVAMLSYMLKDTHVTRDDLFALVAVFTLIAFAFAHLFIAVQALDPGAFATSRGEDQPLLWTEALFLSVASFTNTGLSDIVPVDGHARSVVILAEVSGVFYIGMVISRLISMRTARREA